jgi:alpha-galactosidase
MTLNHRYTSLGLLAVLVAGASPTRGDGLALTPPMGWNSWNKFGCDVSEKLIKETADTMVASGMKDPGTGTCQNRPGSKDHEEIDARTYAEWGVDYLKYDWCNSAGQDTRDSYARMSRALKAAGRPIVFSICEWGSTSPWLWAQSSTSSTSRPTFTPTTRSG